jgi:FlaA1/EpsC-like NDP-sugar epimerase
MDHGTVDIPPNVGPTNTTTTLADSYYSASRSKLAEILESRRAHLIILSLVVLDLFFVLVEILISLFDRDEWEAHIAVNILSDLSLAIVCLFAVEQALHLYAFGIRYFASWLHLLDVCVIIGSLVAELILKGREREAASLLIILRFWRVLRVMDAAALTVGIRMEQEQQELQKQIAILKGQLADKQNECETLQRQLDSCTCAARNTD